jgi:phage gp46-like protein
MSDISTVWNRDLGHGDWSFNPTMLHSENVALQSPALFGIGDGISTQFQLRDGPAAVNQPFNLSIYRKDWQGDQLLYPTPRTNELSWSEDFTNAAWIRTNVTITPGIADPQGGANASTLTASASVPRQLKQILSAGATLSRTNAIWMRRRSGTGNVNLWSPDISTPNVIVGMSTAWTRYSAANSAGTARTFLIELTAVGDQVDIFAADMKPGALTSYIPATSASITSTDYTVDPTGNVTLAAPPLVGAQLTWLGSYIRNTVRPGGQLANGNDLQTAILISLFTDREASPDDVIPDGTNDRRGWIGDEGEEYKIGSRIWLLSRAKQTTETLNRAFDYIAEGLQWLLDDDVVAKFDITVEWTRAGMLGSKVVAYQKDGSTMALNFSWVWKGLN